MASRLLILLAACSSATPSIANRRVPPVVPPELAAALAPTTLAGVIAPHTIDAPRELRATAEEDDRVTQSAECAAANAMTGDGAALGCPDPIDIGAALAYDLDGDGTADLVMFPHQMFGAYQGRYQIDIRTDDRLTKAFPIDGKLVDERDDGDGITLRFETAFAENDPVLSFTLRFTVKQWLAPIAVYRAQQTALPRALAPLVAFASAAPLALRAAPVIDDQPLAADLDYEERTTAVIAGNVLARFDGHARGYVVATSGEWSFVAIDPATPPSAIRMRHAHATEELRPWLLGWMHR